MSASATSKRRGGGGGLFDDVDADETAKERAATQESDGTIGGGRKRRRLLAAQRLQQQHLHEPVARAPATSSVRPQRRASARSPDGAAFRLPQTIVDARPPPREAIVLSISRRSRAAPALSLSKKRDEMKKSSLFLFHMMMISFVGIISRFIRIPLSIYTILVSM